MKFGLQRKQFWKKLEEITSKAEKSGLKGLTVEELRILPSLYRRTISDLSLLRTTGVSSELEVWLNNLVNRSYSLIYSNQPTSTKSFLSFLIYEYPLAIYKYRFYIYWGFLIFFVGSILGYITEYISPQYVDMFMGNTINYYRDLVAAIPPGVDDTKLQLASKIEPDEMLLSFIIIALNNIRVAFIAFIAGVFAGLLTYLVLLFNGFMVGCITAIYFRGGHSLYFLAGILPHGAWELPLICLSGGAGIIIGLSWLFPQNQLRRVALAQAGQEAWKIIAPVALWLLITALIEGFVTPWRPVTDELRYALMISIGVFNLFLFVFLHYFLIKHALRTQSIPNRFNPKTKAVPTLQSTNPERA